MADWFLLIMDTNSNILSGVSQGGARDASPPGGPNSFNFMQFLGNFGKIVCWRPLLGEILDPPLILVGQSFASPGIPQTCTGCSPLVGWHMPGVRRSENYV